MVGLPLWAVWLIVTVILLIIEGSTTILVTIWFAGGTLAAMIAAFLGASPTVQVIIFVVVSIVCLLIGWRYRDKLMMQRHKTPTNADRFMGKIAVIEEAVDPITGKGRLMVAGQSWRAHSEDGREIPAGTKVVIRGISGTKLIVEPLDETKATGPTP